MHAIERELIKATGYKAQRKFTDRQDYLKSILNSINKLDNDDFDNLSDEAAVWANNAVEAHNGKQELPDFDEVSADEDEDAVIEEASAEAAGLTEPETDPEDEAAEDDETSEDDETAFDPETGEVIEDEADEEPEVEKPAKKAAKPKQLDLPLKKEKAKPAPKAPGKTPFAHDAVLDKWGAIEGSKNSMALALFEKGATTKEVKEKLGGTYYNILGRAVKAGHVLEKEGALMKLTHRDNVGAKKAPKAAAKPVPKKGKK